MTKQVIHLSQEFLDKVKTILLEEKTKLENELNKFTEKNPHTTEEDFDAVYPDYGDKSDENAQEITDFLANKPLEMNLEKTLRDINKALESIQKGTYGTCKYCKEPIDEKRLIARPTSSACISCKKTLTQEA
ncbi:MAG: TraR/DksA family transcriptional regulator [Candidatus Magasanikbacteria bacterium]|jgi:DnaK suppressor protein